MCVSCRLGADSIRLLLDDPRQGSSGLVDGRFEVLVGADDLAELFLQLLLALGLRFRVGAL